MYFNHIIMDKERDFVTTECLETPEGSVSSRSASPVIMDIIERKVKNFLEEKKVYLDPTMSLQKFSSITSTNTTYLSNTVNDCFGCSFRTLLNRYRVEYAKTFITNDGGLVKDLYKKCGFASRSAFYSSFKGITGLTPLQYLKKSISDNAPYWK